MTKTDELKALEDSMYLQDMLLKPADVILGVGVGSVFPVPDCNNCEGSCCAPQLDFKLCDIARFMDNGLDKFIMGTFESYVEHSLSVLDGGRGVKHPFPYIAPVGKSVYCRFLKKDQLCGIYEARICACRAFPLGVVRDENEDIIVQWFGDQCKMASDESLFWMLVDNAIENWNEGVKTQILLMNARDELRKLGFGKYLGDERRYMMDEDE